MDHLTCEKNHRILIVDDNAALHEDFRKILCPSPGTGAAMAATEEMLFGAAAVTAQAPTFAVDSAFQGQEGLVRVCEAMEQRRPYAVAFIDVRMPPGWDGIETTLRIWEACPDLEVVICTAYSDYSLGEMLARVGNEERLVILKKPFDTIEVLQLANALTGKWRWHQEAKLKMDYLDKLAQERTMKLVQANACLREQARLLDLAQDAIIVWDLEGQVRFWNKGAERLYGWTAAEVAGVKMDARYCGTQAARDKERKAWQALERGEWSGELRHMAKNGKPVLVQSRWTLVRDNQGQPESVLIINTDIMEKKELEAQFHRAQRMDSIGTLAGGIAHDLNNVLAPVMMIGPLLRAQIQDEEGRALLESMERGAARGANIVKEILTFSRRGGASKKAPLHPYRLLQGAAGYLADTFPKTIRVEFSAPKDLWMVEGNSADLHQALMNLCANAREAMPGGGALTLQGRNAVLDPGGAAAIPNAHPGRYVVWRVADTGVGIAPENLDHIFDPFFTTKDIGKGPGLGLSSVLGTVTGCGGSIQVKSELGQGTEFIIHLPAMDAAPEGSPARLLPEPPRGQGELLLVIEEDASLGALLETILNAAGYRVLGTADGAEAVELFRRHQEELSGVLADAGVEMPDGESVAGAIFACDPAANIIVGTDLPADQWPALPEALHRSLLRKPYATNLLLDKLRGLLNRPNRRLAAVAAP
jgi:two-component system, cell cycle sensor histidine kinase and response regulator CckA